MSIPPNEISSFLTQVPLFSSIPRNHLLSMTEMFDLMFVAKGSVICREGEIGDAMYIIRSGAVGIYIDRDGKEVPIFPYASRRLFR